MALTIAERKERLPYGAQKQVAAEAGVDPALVSLVVNDKAVAYSARLVRSLQVRLARKMGVRVGVAFDDPRVRKLAEEPTSGTAETRLAQHAA